MNFIVLKAHKLEVKFSVTLCTSKNYELREFVAKAYA
jgi:hypothetical protein